MSPSSVSARISARPKELPGSSKSLQKALRILLHVGDSGREVGVTQVATALSLNKTTVHRLLNALARFGLIEKNPISEQYRLGLRLHDLGTRAIESRTLRSEARPFLVELSRRSKEAVSLAVPGADGIFCLDRVDSPHTVITVRTTVGAKFPAHCTAIGKAALAYVPEGDFHSVLSSVELIRYTQFTLTRVPELKKNLEQVRQKGYALDHQELERGLSGVAAPVLTREGRLLAAVGIAGPTPRFRGKELAQKIALAKEIAARISNSLGNRPI